MELKRRCNGKSCTKLNYYNMLHFLPQRTSYRSSFLFVLAGLFFISYAIIGIIRNDSFVRFLPTQELYLQIANVITFAIGLLLIGFSCLLMGIKSILEKRQRENLYKRTEYQKMAKALALSRDLGILVLVFLGLVNLLIGVVIWIF